MLSNQIMSIPVVDQSTKKPLYVLSLVHLVDYLLEHYSPSDFSNTLFNKVKNYLGTNQSQAFFTTPLSELAERATLDVAHVLNEKDNLVVAFKKLVDTKTHRVLVMDDKSDLTTIITQSRLVQVISSIFCWCKELLRVRYRRQHSSMQQDLSRTEIGTEECRLRAGYRMFLWGVSNNERKGRRKLNYWLTERNLRELQWSIHQEYWSVTSQWVT